MIFFSVLSQGPCKMKSVQLLGLLFTLTHLSYQAKIQTKIVNGHEIDIKDYPYQALLIMSGELNATGNISFITDYSRCGGSIISRTQILTAAHCLKQLEDAGMFTAKKVDVFLGSAIFKEGKQYVAKNWKMYPTYNESDEYHLNDIAIVFLKEKNTLSTTVQAIGLPSSSKEINLVGQTVFVSGWGDIGANSLASRHLRGTEMVLTDPKSCDMPKGKLCALISVKMPGHIYFGDSGGPAVINKTLYGVGTTIDARLPDTTQSHFTSVIYYLDWIKKTTK